MTKPARLALGLMSGTSADGIDAALLVTDGMTVAECGPWLTVPYEPDMRRRLRGLSSIAALVATGEGQGARARICADAVHGIADAENEPETAESSQQGEHGDRGQRATQVNPARRDRQAVGLLGAVCRRAPFPQRWQGQDGPGGSALERVDDSGWPSAIAARAGRDLGAAPLAAGLLQV